jgi:hypothetical protein
MPRVLQNPAIEVVPLAAPPHCEPFGLGGTPMSLTSKPLPRWRRWELWPLLLMVLWVVG